VRDFKIGFYLKVLFWEFLMLIPLAWANNSFIFIIIL
jgi:hypothetical protein